MAELIAFEGIDGTGKGTQMELAAAYLRKKGLKVLTLGFPVYESFFGAEVGKLLTGKEGVTADTVDRKSMALWFAMDRFDALKNADFSEYDAVLINRYVLSNAVYQSVRERDLSQDDFLDFVLTLEHERLGLPRPDAYLLYDMDPESARGNVKKKGFRDYVGSADSDVYESIPEIQKRAREKYRAYAARLDNVEVIQCMENGSLLPIEAVANLTERVLDRLLGL